MDMLEVCNEGLSVAAWRSQMAIWSIMTSPLILGNNPLDMTEECLGIIGNEEIIALNQDPNVQRAKLVYQWPDPLPFGKNTSWVPPQAPPPPKDAPGPPHGATMNVSISLQIWVKHLASGDIAAVAFNREQQNGTAIVANITGEMLGLELGMTFDVRDLFLHKTVAENVTAYSATVAPMDSVAVRFSRHAYVG
jgi:hypothetical protein